MLGMLRRRIPQFGRRTMPRRLFLVIMAAVLLVGGILPVLALTSQPAKAAANGLVAYWKLDEDSGTTATDDSGNGNHGTLQYGAEFTGDMDGGKVGGGVECDGWWDWVEIDQNFKGDLDSFTVSMWVNVDSLTYINSLYYRLNGEVLYPRAFINTNGSVRLQYRIDGNTQTADTGAGVITAGDWYHIVTVHDSALNRAIIYVNGDEETNEPQADGELTGGVNNMRIGWDHNLPNSGFDGVIDEVRVYDTALGEDAVKELYEQGTIVAKWSMSEGQEDTIADLSGNDNDGTMVGDTTRTDGKDEDGLEFDGSYDYVEIDQNFKGDLDSFTVSMWVNVDSLTYINSLYYRLNGEVLYPRALINTNGSVWLQYRINGNTQTAYTGAGVITTGEWYHIVTVHDSALNRAIIYVNGDEETNEPQADGELTGGVKNMRIGWDHNLPNSGFDGIIDEVTVYDRALTDTEVVDLFRSVATYYVDGVNGDDGNDGKTTTTAFRTIGRAAGVVAPGDVVHIRGGVYYFGGRLTFDRSGTSGNPITFEAYPGETPIIDGSNASLSGWQPPLVRVSASWNVFKNLEIRNSPGRGIYVSSDDNVFEYVVTHHNGGSGINVGGGDDNQFLYVTAHNNYDPGDSGHHADGVSISSGTANILRGCLFYENSDDGLDTWLSTGNTIENSVAYDNGYDDGDGNGFKLGPGGGNHVTKCISFTNGTTGFTNNQGANNIIENCTACNNGTNNFESYNAVNTFRNNIAYGRVGMYAPTPIQSHNTWNLGIDDPQFLSTDPASPDFLSLSSGSDCLGAGDDGSDLGALQYGQTIQDICPVWGTS